MRVFDLTHPLSPETQVYPGDPPVRFAAHAELDPDGCRVTELRLGTHAGTHLDAPAHFLSAGAAVDRLPLEKLIGPARVIHLNEAAPDVAAGERVLIRSGWGRRWGAPEYFTEFPGLPAALAERLARAPVALLGLETPSLHPDHDEDARLHRLLLEAEVVIVENLARLDELPERVFLTALPLPLVGADGSPCRVTAWELDGDMESERG